MQKINTICLVDDDEIYVFLAKHTIQNLGICDQVLSFSNGFEAIEYLKATIDFPDKIPQLILLDIDMPVMNGWDFLTEYALIKDKLRDEIVIYMASMSMAIEDITRAENYAEITAYLPKPIRSNEFLTISQRLLLSA
ncbi:MAG: hypothetical protein RI894_1254 [Bacteroidota bacterium]|jgi:CheY-like chemotaxis protein